MVGAKLKNAHRKLRYHSHYAMPYMENEQPISQEEAYQWFASLIENVKAQAPLDKVLFEFQAVNWRNSKTNS